MIEKATPPEQATGEPQQTISLSTALLGALQKGGFIEDGAAKPLKWIATNSRTSKPNNPQPNKRALLNLLCILKYSDNVIKDKKLLKGTFSIEFKANNYTDITDGKGNLKRPIISEYHSRLSDIVNKNKPL
jgi:hypothetical protein